MEIIRDIAGMQAFGRHSRAKGLRLGLVPTMGYLHAGHLSLLELLRGECDLKGASLFVNPLQFGPGEDYERYPHDEAGDLAKLDSAGCDWVFIPTVDEMYPPDFGTYVEVPALSKTLCGQFRPGHFRGVATVVLRLFVITGCNAAAFGLKDYQQVQIIRKMNDDLNLGVQLVFGPTVREPDGLAMSSRNSYLAPDERRRAAALPRALEWARQRAAQAPVSATDLKAEVRRRLTQGGLEVQYVDVVHPEHLTPLESIGDRALLAVAVFCGRTRLIDNVILGADVNSAPFIDTDVEG